MGPDSELKNIKKRLDGYYEKKAKTQAWILVTDSVIKFSIPAIISAIVSMFILSPFTTDISKENYVDVFDNPVNPLFFGGVIVIITIIILFIISFFSRIGLSKQEFHDALDVIRYERWYDKEKEKSEYMRKKRELQDLREKEQGKEIAQKERLERDALEQKENGIIDELDEIIEELNSIEPFDRKTGAQRFQALCNDGIVLDTENNDLINKIGECLTILNPERELEMLEPLIDGFHDLVMDAHKCTYLNLASEKLYDKIKSFVETKDNIGQNYMENMYHIFCNIAALGDIGILLEPFQSFEWSESYAGRYREYLIYSLFVNNFKDTLREEIKEAIKNQRTQNVKNFRKLSDQIIHLRIKYLLNKNEIPRCKQMGV